MTELKREVQITQCAGFFERLRQSNLYTLYHQPIMEPYCGLPLDEKKGFSLHRIDKMRVENPSSVSGLPFLVNLLHFILTDSARETSELLDIFSLPEEMQREARMFPVHLRTYRNNPDNTDAQNHACRTLGEVTQHLDNQDIIHLKIEDRTIEIKNHHLQGLASLGSALFCFKHANKAFLDRKKVPDQIAGIYEGIVGRAARGIFDTSSYVREDIRRELEKQNEKIPQGASVYISERNVKMIQHELQHCRRDYELLSLFVSTTSNSGNAMHEVLSAFLYKTFRIDDLWNGTAEPPFIQRLETPQEIALMLYALACKANRCDKPHSLPDDAPAKQISTFAESLMPQPEGVVELPRYLELAKANISNTADISRAFALMEATLSHADRAMLYRNQRNP